MLSDIVDVINTACCKAITPGCKTASTLHQLSAKVFTKEVNKICQYGVRISVLHDLPTTVLSSVLDHMTYFPSLRRKLHQELSDPVLFMKGFASHETDRLKLENCLRYASLIGKPVLPELAKNWCKMLMEIKQPIRFSSILNKVVKTITFGAYLHEAGWVFQSMEVLDIALLMISQAKENKNHEALEMICVKHKLRAEGSALLRTKADTTCSILLTMIENTTDSEDLLKVYLEVANHNFKAHRIAESHHWTRRAMELMTESTSDDSIIEILQLESVYLFHSQRHEAGTLIISQAIHRAKITFGYLNRRYADTLYTYAVCLLQSNAISDALSVLLELLEVINKVYGKFTPHVVIIRSYLAYGFYRRSQTSGRCDVAYDHIQQAITLAKQLMPERREIISHLGEIRAMIMKGRDDILAAIEENSTTLNDDFSMLTVAEIKQMSFQLND